MLERNSFHQLLFFEHIYMLISFPREKEMLYNLKRIQTNNNSYLLLNSGDIIFYSGSSQGIWVNICVHSQHLNFKRIFTLHIFTLNIFFSDFFFQFLLFFLLIMLILIDVKLKQINSLCLKNTQNLGSFSHSVNYWLQFWKQHWHIFKMKKFCQSDVWRVFSEGIILKRRRNMLLYNNHLSTSIFLTKTWSSPAVYSFITWSRPILSLIKGCASAI